MQAMREQGEPQYIAGVNTEVAAQPQAPRSAACAASSGDDAAPGAGGAWSGEAADRGDPHRARGGGGAGGARGTRVLLVSKSGCQIQIVQKVVEAGSQLATSTLL